MPKSLVVIGGGYIGLELGSGMGSLGLGALPAECACPDGPKRRAGALCLLSVLCRLHAFVTAVWSRLGAEVTVVEFLDNIVPSMVRSCWPWLVANQSGRVELVRNQSASPDLHLSPATCMIRAGQRGAPGFPAFPAKAGDEVQVGHQGKPTPHPSQIGRLSWRKLSKSQREKRSQYVQRCLGTVGMINNPAPVAHLQVASAEATTDGVNLALQPSKGNDSTELMSADVVLVSTGMRACPEDTLKDAAY